jgi:multidrug resistance efflux pump
LWAAAVAGALVVFLIVTVALVRSVGGDPIAVSRAGIDELGGEFVVSAFGPAIRLRQVRFVWSFSRKGRIEPSEAKPVANLWSGTIKSIWDDGAEVKKGDIVLEIDTREIDLEIDELRADIIVREAELEQAKQKRSKQIKSAEQQLRRAELELEWQQLNERSVLAGAEVDELARARAAFKTRSLVARSREEEVRILVDLAAQGFATATELGQKKLQLTEANLEREKARIKRDLLVEGSTRLEKKEAALLVKIAEYTCVSAARKLDSMKELAASGVTRAERNLRRKKRDLQEELEAREKHFSRSPADGYVLHVPPWYLSELKPGQRLWRGMKVMSIPSSGKLKIATKVTQAEVDRVAVGTECRVRVPARPGKIYEGEVTSVARQGSDEFADLDGATREMVGESGRQTFAVEVKLSGNDPDLKIGFRADVEFLLDDQSDALVVPLGAVINHAGGARVTVLDRGRPAEREVKLGPSNGRVVVIKSGCKEGEVVLLARGGG